MVLEQLVLIYLCSLRSPVELKVSFWLYWQNFDVDIKTTYLHVNSGLFHRAIIMSGSALSDWAIAHHPLQATMQVIQSLNCPLREDNEEMLICLRKKRYKTEENHKSTFFF